MSPLPRTARATITSLITEHRLGAYADQLRGGIVPAFKLVTAPRRKAKHAPSPTSKFGGEPHLAWDEPWPSHNGRPLHFLAQIRLSEIPKGHLPRGLLPDRGWLRLWLDTLGYRIEDSVDPGKFHITFEPDESRLLQTRPWPLFDERRLPDWGERWRPFPEAPMTFEPILCLDHRVWRQLNAAIWDAEGPDGEDRLSAFIEKIQAERREGNHRLLGDVIELQSDMREECERHARGLTIFDDVSNRLQRTINTAKDRWRLLVRLDSQRHPMNWCWGDAGALNWFIRDDDLKQRAFHRACGVWDNGG